MAAWRKQRHQQRGWRKRVPENIRRKNVMAASAKEERRK